MRGRYPRWAGSGARLSHQLPPSSSPTSKTRLPRLRSGTQGGAATPTNPLHNHTPTLAKPTCRGASCGHPPGRTGSAATPPTFRPLPTSGIPPNRLPRLRSGTQGSAATPTSPLHNHTPTLAKPTCRGASCGHPPGRTGDAAIPINLPPLTHIRHSPKPSSPTKIGDPGERGYPRQPATQPHPHTGQPPKIRATKHLTRTNTCSIINIESCITTRSSQPL